MNRKVTSRRAESRKATHPREMNRKAASRRVTSRREMNRKAVSRRVTSRRRDEPEGDAPEEDTP